MRYIYLILSSTPTKFAYCIRKVGRTRYNHAAISLDENLEYTYAYARRMHKTVFLSGLVRENLDRYTLKKNKPVPISVYRIPVTEREYEWIKNIIMRMENDTEYMYNLYSVLTYPVTKGFRTYKSFTCTEFVTHILRKLNYPINKPCYSYRPDDLIPILDGYNVYEGDIRRRMISKSKDDKYFTPLTFGIFMNNLKAFYIITRRAFFKKGW